MDLNRLKVGQFVGRKKDCYKCGSLSIILTKKEVLGKISMVYLCIDCETYYLDINQFYELQYGKNNTQKK